MGIIVPVPSDSYSKDEESLFRTDLARQVELLIAQSEQGGTATPAEPVNPYWPVHDAGTLTGEVALDAGNGLTQIAVVSGEVTITGIDGLVRPMSLKVDLEEDATLTLSGAAFAGDREFTGTDRAAISFVRMDDIIVAFGRGYDVMDVEVDLSATMRMRDLLSQDSHDHGTGPSGIVDGMIALAELSVSLGPKPPVAVSMDAIMRMSDTIGQNGVTTATEQTFTLSGEAWKATGGSVNVEAEINTSRPRIRSGAVFGGAEAYLRRVLITRDPTFSPARASVSFAVSSSVSGATTGPDMADSWESNLRAITVTVGTRSVTIPGPNAGGWSRVDSSEPYYVYANPNTGSRYTSIANFVDNVISDNSVSAGGIASISITVTIRW